VQSYKWLYKLHVLQVSSIKRFKAMGIIAIKRWVHVQHMQNNKMLCNYNRTNSNIWVIFLFLIGMQNVSNLTVEKCNLISDIIILVW